VTIKIYKESISEVANRLPYVPEEHNSVRLHDHPFGVSVYVQGHMDSRPGWLTDFADIKTATQPLLDHVNHYCYNEIDRLDNPTSEKLGRWIWARPKSSLPILNKLIVSEMCTTGCVFWGNSQQMEQTGT
jgi:6-pyruvoyltetrahydropterin/6-carboxytetrahydropterin synthase